MCDMDSIFCSCPWCMHNVSGNEGTRLTGLTLLGIPEASLWLWKYVHQSKNCEKVVCDMEWSAQRIQASFAWSLSPLQWQQRRAAVARWNCVAKTVFQRCSGHSDVFILNNYFMRCNVCGIDSKPLQVNTSPVTEIIEIRPVRSNPKTGGMSVQFAVLFLTEA
jgi:hypothetical protein